MIEAVTTYQPHNVRACATCPTAITGHGNRRYCEECREAQRLSGIRRRAAGYNAKRKKAIAAWHLKTRYGLDSETHRLMLGGGCRACGSKDGKLCVDHDHASGRVRGILCDGCNKALGLLGDSSTRVAGLLAYLQETA